MTVLDWLKQIGYETKTAEAYASIFRNNGFNTLRDLVEEKVTEPVLEKIGIPLLKDQMKISRELTLLKPTVAPQQGFLRPRVTIGMFRPSPRTDFQKAFAGGNVVNISNLVLFNDCPKHFSQAYSLLI